MAFPYYMGEQNEPSNQSAASSGNYTYVMAEACPDGGYISKIEVYINDAVPNGFQFSVFSRDVNNFTDEHYKEDFTVGAGLNTFTEGVDYATDLFPIDTGEYFGWYQPSQASMDRNNSGGLGYLYDSGDQIGDDGASAFSDTQESGGRLCQIRVTIRSAFIPRTITAKANIQITISQEIQVKANIKGLGIEQTINAKAEMHMFVELFDSNTYKDAGETDADWNITEGRVKLSETP